jgi:hypothetical protein
MTRECAVQAQAGMDQCRFWIDLARSDEYLEQLRAARSHGLLKRGGRSRQAKLLSC